VNLAEQVIAGDRRALARAITLVESTRDDHRTEAAELLDALLPHTGQATRIGISGAPGVGKSMFIEAFGTHLVTHGHRVAVLAVDPSSVRSGGSILGDKTRMEALARDPNAYIRPSPSGGALGGVTRRTREAMLVCEAAGFDVVLVETVGVGQSEIEVDDMVDAFVLLVAPGGGDELQGIKRGVMEMADIVVVTKADGELLSLARNAMADYRAALHLLRHKHEGWEPEVVLCSALSGDGVGDVWAALERHRDMLTTSGALSRRRSTQATAWLWKEINDSLLTAFRDDARVAPLVAAVERRVAGGEVSPASGALELLAAHRRG
jgi:LAO/AO transport system kinase